MQSLGCMKVKIIFSVLMLGALVMLTAASPVEKKESVVQKSCGQFVPNGECMTRTCSETVIQVVILPLPPFFFPVPVTNVWTESVGCGDESPGGEDDDDPIVQGGGGCSNC